VEDPVRRPLIALAIAALVGATTPALPAATAMPDIAGPAAVPGVVPSTVDIALQPGQSTTITKSVTTPVIPPNPDIILLADTTGSMGGAGGPLDQVQQSAGSIIEDVQKVQNSARFAVASYKDEIDGDKVYEVLLDLTADPNTVVTDGVRKWEASGGGLDAPEAAINALFQLAQVPNSKISYRDKDTKIIVWFGDAPSKNPSKGIFLADAISALTHSDIHVVAVTLGSLGLNGTATGTCDSNDPPQATCITQATHGALVKPVQNDVVQAIKDAIKSVQSTVIPTTKSCDPQLSVSNSPPSMPVDSGKTATFSETITLAPGAAPGVYHCVVDYKIGDASSPEFSETTTVRYRNDPPRPAAGGPYSGNQGTDVPIAGTVVDSDGPGLTTTWSIADSEGVPVGACTFGNPNALSTTVNCAQRGTYRLTLTADDHANPPVSDTTTLTLRNVPPTPSAGGPYSGNEDNDVAIAGSVTDPDGPALTTTWSITDAEGLPPAATCTFGDPSALSTVVNCSERGTYRLTLTADDHLNPPVSDSTTVTFKNVPPTPSAGGPYSGNEDNDVAIAGTVRDPDGPSLTTTWTITPAEGVPPGAACTFGDPSALSTVVNCTERGVYRLTLTADDHVNPPVSDSTTVTLKNVPPTPSAGGPYSGNEDNNIAITGTVNDPDGPPVTTTWSITPADGVPEGATCKFGDPNALQTTVNCTDRGTYTLTLTADDHVNPPVAVSTTVTLKNVAPTVSAGGPYVGEEDHRVAIAGTVRDPDSPGLTSTWTIVPNRGVNPAAVCSFTDPTKVSTVLTCSEPGSYTLTLTVDDKVNPPISVSTTVTLSKTLGSLSMISVVGPTTGFVGGDPVVLTVTVHNAGPAAMTAVRLVTTIPGTLKVKEVSLAGCSGSCELGTLAPGQTVQVRVTFASDAPIDQVVSAVVTTTGPDIDQRDNGGSVRVVVRQPVLTVDPTAGPQGFVAHVTGTDFPAGARIQLHWSVGISETPGEWVVGADGKLDAWALVFPKDTRGLRNLLADPVAGARFGQVTSNPFLVLSRSLQPLDFVIR
jgi:uncharacterized repeat protein (TIGR01451 family)